MDGRIKANAAIVVAGTGNYAGEINIYVTNTTDVILDIDGYFLPATGSALAFYPMTPCRVADTRMLHGGMGSDSRRNHHRFHYHGRHLPEVQNTALAYSLNLAAVPPGALGYLTVWPAGAPRPVVSTLNDLTGTIVANAALVGAGMGMNSGMISVYPRRYAPGDRHQRLLRDADAVNARNST